ncbi:MAG: SGNH/GDSL hydrolase family protein [Flavihumibacter sp.]|nr:SGNH/GDSL hydrolase family protein [Flavihumibacter sp.]
MTNNQYAYLALGDSYTIGEAVPVYENFPYQTVQLLRKAGHHFHAAEIVAKTGWTTDELQNGINATRFQSSYNFVSLLIGVNNQYRGRSVEEYQIQFENLLQQAIRFANKKAASVFVLSIPDWGVTPFARDRDIKKISSEIDAFNAANKKLTDTYQCNYINITPLTCEAASDTTLLAADQLHPSGKDYKRWAQLLSTAIINKL